MKKYFNYILLILLPCFIGNCISLKNSQTSYWKKLEQAEFKNKQTVYWAYGYSEPHEAAIRDLEAKKMGFNYTFVLGCQVNNINRKAIEKHNKKVGKMLSKKISADWKEKFYKGVGSLELVYSETIKKIEQDVKLWDTLAPIFDTLNNKPHQFFIYSTDLPDRFIMNYSEVDSLLYHIEKKIIYSLEVLLPDYKLRLIKK